MSETSKTNRCMILGPEQVKKLIHRYDGIGKPLSNDDRELLLFALYCESEARDGIVKEARSAEPRTGG